MVKYRISALAKDLEIKSKDVIEILTKHGLPGRSHASSLESEELSFVFEEITQNNQIDITAFFKKYEDKKAEKQRAEAEQKRKEAEEARKKAGFAAPPVQQKKPKEPQQPQKQRARGETRVVDTRGTVTVDLSKYDKKLEKFETVAGDTAAASRQKTRKKTTRESAPVRSRGQRQRGQKPKSTYQPIPVQLNILVPDEITVTELALRMKTQVGEVIKKLMSMGLMVTANQTIDYDSAYLVAEEFGVNVAKEVVVTIEEKLFDESEDKDEDLVLRAPVVVVMGHVDHGKTSLLDAIRNARVTAGEAGGITQHIGAYSVKWEDKDITFLDTPGHAAFTSMRARGADITDIAVLVVAADDGVMPQTVEAINHAKAAGVEIIVAINKMDKPDANPDRVLQELTQHNLVPEEWGGDTICVKVSALKRTGIDSLLEMILLSAEMMELKANPKRAAKGVVIEAQLDRGRGVVATLLVQNGTLKSGDYVIAGTSIGRIRAMTDDKGKRLKTAGPSTAVEIMGLSEVPDAGDEFNAVVDERMARTLADQRKHREKQEQFEADSKVNLESLFNQISSGVKTLNIIIKADVQGSAEAVKQSLEKLSNEEVSVVVIHTGVGGITENDVMLASTSNAIIVGFNVRPDKLASDMAARDKVDIRTYRVIYECIEEIQAAIKGMLAPKYREVILGRAEVRQTIRVPNVGTIAGCYITDGKVQRNAGIRVVRDGVIIFEDKISSLKRFKDDVREVQEAYECGIGLDKFNDIKDGDILEAYVMEEIKD